MSPSEFDAAVESYREALQAFLNGDWHPVAAHFSRRDDVTLANPFGPPARGWPDVEATIAAAAANFEAGSCEFEEVSRYATPDLAYVLHLERAQVRLAGTSAMAPSTLRVTMIFRREGAEWKVAHRHADPIASPRPATTILNA